MGRLNVVKRGSYYTLGEELSCSISHGIASLLAAAGAAVMIVFACLYGDMWKIVSSAIYGGSMVVLFTMSTLYHAIINPKAKMIFRVFDHTSIFLLIAGTYTPITLVLLREKGIWGWTIFSIVWIFGILGIIFNSIDVNKYKKFSMICYIASGWCIFIAFIPFVQAVDIVAVILLLLGGVAYTSGIYFYKQKRRKHFHGIWHWFVFAGAVFHYFCILFYVIL